MSETVSEPKCCPTCGVSASEALARIAKLETALISANTDAETLFGWAVLAEHSWRCMARHNDTATCNCDLQDDLQVHMKRVLDNQANA